MSIDSSFDTPEHFEEESKKSPETLEREIDQQRSSIGNIVDALEKKMSPGQLVDQALGYVKDNGGEFFGNLGNNVKANPVPAVLTTVGVLWMMMGNNRPATGGSSNGSSVLGSVTERAGSMAGSVSDSLGSAKARVQETVSHMKDKASTIKDKTSHMTHNVRDTFSGSSGSSDSWQDADLTFQEKRGHMKSSTRQLVNEQPLTLAAMGIAVGALIGAALPVTTKEQQIVRQAREKLRGKSGSLSSSSSPNPTSSSYSNLSGAEHDSNGTGASSASERPTSPGLG
ncbi:MULTISPECIES: DUF3618 domain-containing protein [Pseudomonas syringae group]|uniref:DUF3618 domain-containing protein n=1 Tax=Pseudomonas syringae pv. primulae TaxID=251707 RepID=A0A0N8SJT9_9PSED|nr:MULTISPECIES: DUF3618 domain-containing protein [Pseudomonas syringae group]KPY33320.1 Uncharacterized protein ALO52_04185 [Pseudomonas syringae pv. primulae]MBD8187043.1 DUF3618 domain-containing protein [Pseudomonas viridiflava]MBD8203142.1 DUF3618 domain-containing protein [Pseudomonas viridiflava]